jgi:hypothetical protein
MKRQFAVYLLAMIGVLSSDNLADAQAEVHSSGGPLPSGMGMPAIDAVMPDRLATATFALG